MKKGIMLFMVVVTLCVVFSACKSHSTTAYYSFETEYIDNPGDGSVILRAWGTGPDRSEALKSAQKRAVHDVIFKGFRNHTNLKPLILEVNAEEKYEDYFEKFFSPKGDYMDFIRMDVTKMGSGEKYVSKTRDSYAVVVRVLRKSLKSKLIEDNIIK